jgi:stress response protein SCP2/uncharacterized protein involved in tellurium resistance
VRLIRIEYVELAARRLRLALHWENLPTTPDIDIVLILPAAGAVHFASPQGVAGAVQHLGKKTAAVSTDRVELDLAALDQRDDQVIVGVMADGRPLAEVRGLRLRLVDVAANSEILRVDLAPSAGDLVFVAGELRRKDARWYYRGLGFGFSDGLAGLAARFGVPLTEAIYHGRPSRRVARSPGPASVPAESTTPRDPETRETGPPEGTASRRNHGAGQGVVPVGKVNLLPGARATIPKPRERITASLIWKRLGKDLDLYALYIDGAGKPGVCYYRNQGSLRRPPYVCLTTGDRYRGRETIEIARPDAFRYILICAYSAVENGIGSFRSFRAGVVVDDQCGSVVHTPLYHRNAFSYWVAIALIDLSGADSTVIEHVETYSRSGSERRPVLRADGAFVMDAGPVEFKTR